MSDTSRNGRRVLTVEEAARLLEIGRRAMYEAIARGEIPGVIRVGRTIRLSAAVFDRYLDSGEADTPNDLEDSKNDPYKQNNAAAGVIGKDIPTAARPERGNSMNYLGSA